MTGNGNEAHGKLALADHLAWRQVDDEIVALDVESSRYMGLNESGALLWTAIAQGTTRSELIRLLADTYTLDAEVAERDVDEFLGQCRRRALVRS
jgi:hypothetical protein